jgi:hypothetical protein
MPPALPIIRFEQLSITKFCVCVSRLFDSLHVLFIYLFIYLFCSLFCDTFSIPCMHACKPPSSTARKYVLFSSAFSVSKDYVVSNDKSDKCIMNWKDLEGSCLGLILRYYPRILLEVLRKTTKPLSQESRFPDQELKPGPPEYETGVLTTRQRRSV